MKESNAIEYGYNYRNDGNGLFIRLLDGETPVAELNGKSPDDIREIAYDLVTYANEVENRQIKKEEQGIKVRRTEVVRTNHFEVGDQITVKVDHMPFTATAISVPSDGEMLFIFDRVIRYMPMFKDGCLENEDYLDSNVSSFLKDLHRRVNRKIRDRLLFKFSGDSAFCLADKEDLEVFPYFKSVLNRICVDASGNLCWWWLCDKVSASTFASVSACGNTTNHGASNSGGVRPIFFLKNYLGEEEE